MSYGRYRVIEEIGHGSMGVVYRAHDPVIGRTVAIKVVRDLPWLTPEQREKFAARFRSEVVAAGALQHPGIVTLFDVGEGYLVMEFVEGQTLATLLRAKQRLPVAQVLNIAGQVADALDFAHARGLVHRQLKPANVMMLPDGGVKVLDFGLPRPRGRDAEGGRQLLGSAAYMAPEQLLGQRAEAGSDIFSLGVVVYELLAGERPFAGTSEAAIVEQIKGASPSPLRRLNPSLPPEYEQIVAKVLAKDPAERHVSAGQFVTELREVKLAEDDSVVPAPAESPSRDASAARGLGPVPSWLRLRPLLAAAAILGATGLVWLVLPRSEPVATTAAPLSTPSLLPRPATPAPAAPLVSPSRRPHRTVLLVTTDPPGARIFVGGQEKGRAPVTLTDPAAGPMVVRAEKERYLPAARLVIVSPGESQGLSLPLERPGVAATIVDVLSMPDGGTLAIDGVVLGKTPAGLSLTPGVHVIEVRKEGFDAWVQEVEVGADPHRIIATLEKKAAPAAP